MTAELVAGAVVIALLGAAGVSFKVLREYERDLRRAELHDRVPPFRSTCSRPCSPAPAPEGAAVERSSSADPAQST